MKISICNKCKGYNFNNLVTKLKNKYPNAIYEIGCNNMCGIGRSKVVVIVDNKPIIADNEDELLLKIAQFTKKENIK